MFGVGTYVMRTPGTALRVVMRSLFTVATEPSARQPLSQLGALNELEFRSACGHLAVTDGQRNRMFYPSNLEQTQTD